MLSHALNVLTSSQDLLLTLCYLSQEMATIQVSRYKLSLLIRLPPSLLPSACVCPDLTFCCFSIFSICLSRNRMLMSTLLDSLNSYIGILSPKVRMLEAKTPRQRLGMRVETPWVGSVPVLRTLERDPLLLLTCTNRTSKWLAVNQKMDPQQILDVPATRSWTSQLPELWEIHFSCL